MSDTTQDRVENVVICGSGPAGLTAALYSARANLSPLVLEGMQPGGQLTITTDVENFPGFSDGVMGPDLMDTMKKQVERFGTRFEFDEVTKCELDRWPFVLHTANGNQVKAKTLVIATGASARYLGLENELRLQGYGVSACATCDGFFYRDEVVAVVGGGDSACEEAHFLTKFASRVHLLVRRDALRASKIMAERVLNNDKIEVHWNTELQDVLGDKQVTGIRVIQNKTSEVKDMNLTGLFLAIGHTPNSGPFTDWVKHDPQGYLVGEPDSSRSNIPGVFLAGDIKDQTYRQAITAAGSGCMAALDAERWLEEKEAGH